MISQAIGPIEIMVIVKIIIIPMIIPVMNIIIGFITGVIIALVFNFMSRYTGGLKLEIEEVAI